VVNRFAGWLLADCQFNFSLFSSLSLKRKKKKLGGGPFPAKDFRAEKIKKNKF